MDQIRLQSEATAVKDKKRAQEEEKIHLAYADVVADGTFRSSIFLDDNVGLATFKAILSTGDDGYIDLSESDTREECIRLLTMEQRSLHWYGLGACSFIYEIVRRLGKVNPLTQDAVKKEADLLEKVLFDMPEKSGDMPKEFMIALQALPIAELRSLCSTAHVAQAREDLYKNDGDVEAMPDRGPQSKDGDKIVVDLS
jgi:hypothetical protein